MVQRKIGMKNLGIEYLNGTYHTCLLALNYVLPALIRNYDADGPAAAKIYVMIGHYGGLLCKEAGGDPLEVLRELPQLGILTDDIRKDNGYDIKKVARDCLDCAAVGYTFVSRALCKAEANAESSKNCLETWAFVTCVVFSLVACVLGQKEASIMAKEVIDDLIEKNIFAPEWDAIVFNEQALSQHFREGALIRDDTHSPDYLSNFGNN
jgi:hypothetical protein